MNFQTNCRLVIYFTFFCNFNPMSFNSTLTPQEICNLALIWAQNDSIVQKKSSRIKLNFLKKKTITIHNEQ